MNPTVGLIGLGTIGMPMAERLLEKEIPLVVWNRTASKAEDLAAQGARRASSPADLAARSDVVVTMVSDGPALEEVALGDTGIVAGLAPGKVHCDMSTIGPRTARKLAAHYAGAGGHFLHAPVLGNRRHAAAGTLLIFAGGPRQAFDLCQPVFAALGRRTWYWVEPEKATCAKLACNLLLGAMMEVFSESIVFAAKAGIAPRDLLDILNQSALAAPMFSAKGETLLARDFRPSFHLRHMNKDLNLVIDHARRIGVALPGISAIRSVYAAGVMRELSEQDYSAVLKVLEENSGITPETK